MKAIRTGVVPDDKFQPDPDQAEYPETDSGFWISGLTGFRIFKVIESPVLSQHNTVYRVDSCLKVE